MLEKVEFMKSDELRDKMEAWIMFVVNACNMGMDCRIM